MTELFKRFILEEDGQGMTEYGLILALVAVVVIGALTLMGEQIEIIFDSIAETLQDALPDTPEPDA